MVIESRVFDILEQSSGRYTAVCVDNDGVTPLPGTTLTTLTLTLYVVKTDGSHAFVNGRNAQNVLNLNNVTIDPTGNIVWAVQTQDTTLVEALAFERHIALFEWTWPNGVGKHELILSVKALDEVP
jgi:hypothetical protein